MSQCVIQLSPRFHLKNRVIRGGDKKVFHFGTEMMRLESKKETKTFVDSF